MGGWTASMHACMHACMALSHPKAGGRPSPFTHPPTTVHIPASSAFRGVAWWLDRRRTWGNLHALPPLCARHSMMQRGTGAAAEWFIFYIKAAGGCCCCCAACGGGREEVVVALCPVDDDGGSG